MVGGRDRAEKPDDVPAISPATESIAGQFRRVLAAELPSVPLGDPMRPFWLDLLDALEAVGTIS